MSEVDTLRSMRCELQKLATEGHGRPTQEYEELNRPRLMQSLVDVPIALAGTGLGYALGRTGAEYLAPHVFQTPGSQEALKRGLPLATAVTGGIGAYLLGQQARLMKDRRDSADAAAKKKELGGTAPVAEVAQMSPANAPVAKMGGAIVPAVAQARRNDPWREDRRYPKFMG